MKPLVLDDLVTAGTHERWALLSPDGLYRYALGVSWDDALPVFDVTMLNPSKADHERPDPTFTRVLHFAKQEGCGGVLIRNLAARRETNQKRLWECTDPVGPRNLEVLAISVPGSVRVAAWGVLDERKRLRLGRSLYAQRPYCTRALRVTPAGHPWHPLYLPSATRLVPFGADPGAAERSRVVVLEMAGRGGGGE